MIAKNLFIVYFGAAASVAAVAGNTFAPDTCIDSATCSSTVDGSSPDDKLDPYALNCAIWPTTGVPLEHRNTSCDRAAQNAKLASSRKLAKECPEEGLIKAEVYLNLPEEKSWFCPLDDTGADSSVKTLGKLNGGIGVGVGDNEWSEGLGHPTRWILYNEASTPILLSYINPLGLEVSAMDFKTYPAHKNNAVYPSGPIVLPGQMAVVDGRQGQTFTAREYKEDVFDSFEFTGVNMNSEEHVETLKDVMPSTWSYSTKQTRYKTGNKPKFNTNGKDNSVMRVLGKPGRVLMKHRMGMIYIKNQYGALCPEMMGIGGEESGEDSGGADDGPRGNPTDPDPDCNVLRKGFINKVGCPIDLYFAPQPRDPSSRYNCELFSKHFGPLDSFSPTPPNKSFKSSDVDKYNSPIKFENTYNGHNFVARMSHDNSLVARVELDHDVVRDCPDPRSLRLGNVVSVREEVVDMIPVSSGAEEVLHYNMSSVSASIYDRTAIWLASKGNTTQKIVEPPKSPISLDGDSRILSLNRTSTTVFHRSVV